MLKAADAIRSHQTAFQRPGIHIDLVLPKEVIGKRFKCPEIGISGLSAGANTTLIRVSLSPGMDVAEMFPNFMTGFKFHGLGLLKVAMIIRTKCVIFVLSFPNMLQPLVFSSKGARLRRTSIIRAFPFTFSAMSSRVVSLEFVLVFEWLFVGTARFGA